MLNRPNQLLFLTDEQLRQGIELLFFAYRDSTGDPDAVLAERGYGRAHHRAMLPGAGAVVHAPTWQCWQVDMLGLPGDHSCRGKDVMSDPSCLGVMRVRVESGQRLVGLARIELIDEEQ